MSDEEFDFDPTQGVIPDDEEEQEGRDYEDGSDEDDDGSSKDSLFGPESDDEDEKTKNDEADELLAASKPKATAGKRGGKKKVVKDDDSVITESALEKKSGGESTWFARRPVLPPTKPLEKQPPRSKQVKQQLNSNSGWKPSLSHILKDRQNRAAEVDDGVIVLKHDVKIKMHRYCPLNKTGDPAKTFKFYSSKTKLACLWCTETFKNPPFPVALSFGCKKYTGEYWFKVRGHYCSPSCSMAAAGVDHRSATRFMFKKVYSLSYRREGTDEIQEITPAPPREALQKFGGPMTIAQFRATGKLGVETRFVELPFLPTMAGYEEVEGIQTSFTEAMTEEQVQRALSEGVKVVQTRQTFNPPSSVKQAAKRKQSTPPATKGRRTSRQRKHSSDKTEASPDNNTSNQDDNTSLSSDTVGPSVQVQIQQSSERLRLQRQEIDSVTKRKKQTKTLMSYMKKVGRPGGVC